MEMINAQNIQDNKKYLQLLSKRFPTIEDVVTEIINLDAILALPKSTEHFMSDLHGQSDAFLHIISNSSGVIRDKIREIFTGRLNEFEQNKFATLIYYPEEKMKLELQEIKDKNLWYQNNILMLIEVCKVISSKYTRSKIRKILPHRFSYVIDELLNNSLDTFNKGKYYKKIIDVSIEIDMAEELIIDLATVIKKLSVDKLHIIGDIYDRGPGPDIIMDLLINHHSVDIEWGNHDILWMGASFGSLPCIAGVINNSARHDNLDILEDKYGINLRPLSIFADNTYKDASIFIPKKYNKTNYDENIEVRLCAKIHKAIFVIVHKLEGQVIKRNKEFNMENRLLLENIDYDNKKILIEGKWYMLEDTDFPTIDKDNPYELTVEEEKIMLHLKESFLNSERLNKHMDFLMRNGSIYKIANSNLLFHALVPLDSNGDMKIVTLEDKRLYGKQLFDYIDTRIREIYYNSKINNTSILDLDLMWYLWTGPDSPFFGKNKMTTFERILIKDKATHKETRNAYYDFQDFPDVIINILKNFEIDNIENAHVINGHIPVERINGETPIKAEGKLIVIDGGFSKVYQKTTGIAGYTLIYSSRGMKLVAHEPFESLDKAIKENKDIHSNIEVCQGLDDEHRLTIANVDKGREIQEEIDGLKLLLLAYKNGIIAEVPYSKDCNGKEYLGNKNNIK